MTPGVMGYLTNTCARDEIPPYGLFLSESNGGGDAVATVCSSVLDSKTRLLKMPHSLTTRHRTSS